MKPFGFNYSRGFSLEVIMSTEKWMGNSTTARKTIDHYVGVSTDKIVQKTGKNYQYVFNNVESAVVNVVEALTDAGIVKATIKEWELAEVLIDKILKLDVDRSDWESVKKHEVQAVRRIYLEGIVKKKTKEYHQLLPIEQEEINDHLGPKDVTADDRYNGYTGFIAEQIEELIDEWRANMFDGEDDDQIKRQDQIRELHRLNSDKRRFMNGTESEVWEIVNKEWGVDGGLE